MSVQETIQRSKLQFEAEPIMERHSHVLGMVRLYAPDAPANEWRDLPWRFESEKGWDGSPSNRLLYVLHPDHVNHAWKHTALIEARHLWPSL